MERIYNASQAIWPADITRKEGIALTKRFYRGFPKASKMFEQPIKDCAYYDKLTDNFCLPHLWKRKTPSRSSVTPSGKTCTYQSKQ